MLEVIGLSLVVVLILIGLIAFFLVFKALFPARVESTRYHADQMTGRSFVIGLVNFVFFFAVALAFFALGNAVGVQFFHVIALFVLIFPVIGIVFGLAGIVELLGERLAPESTGLRRTGLAVLALSLACALPFVGWFGLFPYAGLLGMGAFIISLFQRRPKNVAYDEVEETVE